MFGDYSKCNLMVDRLGQSDDSEVGVFDEAGIREIVSYLNGKLENFTIEEVHGIQRRLEQLADAEPSAELLRAMESIVTLVVIIIDEFEDENMRDALQTLSNKANELSARSE